MELEKRRELPYFADHRQHQIAWHVVGLVLLHRRSTTQHGTVWHSTQHDSQTGAFCSQRKQICATLMSVPIHAEAPGFAAGPAVLQGSVDATAMVGRHSVGLPSDAGEYGRAGHHQATMPAQRTTVTRPLQTLLECRVGWEQA